MKAHELRIGNHVMIENEQHEHVKNVFMQVVGIEKIHMTDKEKEWFPNSNSSISVVCVSGDFMYSRFNQYNQFIKPIELTEEILLKCGCCYDGAFYCKDGIFLEYEDNSLRLDCMSDSVSIKYLHELQNLYFALTGQKLEINI